MMESVAPRFVQHTGGCLHHHLGYSKPELRFCQSESDDPELELSCLSFSVSFHAKNLMKNRRDDEVGLQSDRKSQDS